MTHTQFDQYVPPMMGSTKMEYCVIVAESSATFINHELKQYAEQGFVIHSITPSSNSNRSVWLIVMQKEAE